MAVAVLVGAGVAVMPAAGAAAKYPNCAALNADYPHGVGKTGAKDSTKATPVTNFTVDSKLYATLPKTLDRDHDGIACEKA